MGVKNCSFPLFVSEDVLKREKDHIEGFAAEVAWVTHAYALPSFPPSVANELRFSDITNLVDRPLSRKRSLSVRPRRLSCTPTTLSGSVATAICLCV